MTTPPNILEAVLAERGKRYGAFLTHAQFSQDLKGIVDDGIRTNGWTFDADMLEALEMILHKIARIVNGDPNWSDSWRDIAGYATLVADRLDLVEQP
jgi:hypothetical protein